MDNFIFPDMASVSDFQRKYSVLLDKIKSSSRPLLILKKNKLEAVLLNPSSYEDLVEKVRKYEELQALKAIDGYLEEKKAGKLKKAKNIEELFE